MISKSGFSILLFSLMVFLLNYRNPNLKLWNLRFLMLRVKFNDWFIFYCIMLLIAFNWHWMKIKSSIVWVENGSYNCNFCLFDLDTWVMFYFNVQWMMHVNLNVFTFTKIDICSILPNNFFKIKKIHLTIFVACSLAKHVAFASWRKGFINSNLKSTSIDINDIMFCVMKCMLLRESSFSTMVSKI